MGALFTSDVIVLPLDMHQNWDKAYSPAYNTRDNSDLKPDELSMIVLHVNKDDGIICSSIMVVYDL